MKPTKSESGQLEGVQMKGMLGRVAVVYPSGNTTAIVFDQCLYADRKSLNESVMRAWKLRNPEQPEIEQCCFVTPPQDPDAIVRVEMFGGEFCGNAARGVVWVMAKGQNYRGKIEISGVENPLSCSVNDGEVNIEMPLSKNRTSVRSVAEGSLIQFDGISQLVITGQNNNKTPRQLLTDLLKRNKYDLCNQPAVGVSYYDKQYGKAAFCVWVKEVDTIFDETACGSGTSAIGVALAAETGRSTNLNVVQPSGEIIRTEADYIKGSVRNSCTAGKVNVLYDGEYKLS